MTAQVSTDSESAMSLTLTAEHEALRAAVRDFARKEIVPIAAAFDESGEFPYATIKKMGAMGLMGIEFPEEYGGAGMDTLAYVLAMEEIAKADAAHRGAGRCRSGEIGRSQIRRSVWWTATARAVCPRDLRRSGSAVSRRAYSRPRCGSAAHVVG